MSLKIKNEKKVGYWYFGGLASGMAAGITHPLDLIKVHLQTQQNKQFGVFDMTKNIIKSDGFCALYNGLSASLLRQFTYSTTRFALYETHKTKNDCRSIPFWEKAVVAGFSGFLGGIVGNPADMVNVRMQNDVKLEPALRRNYKHVIDGMVQVVRQEGSLKLFNGVTMTATRAAFVTLGQLAFYDIFKEALLKSDYFGDDMRTHFSASLCAGATATTLTMPFDVMKTRLMNVKSGTYSGLSSCAQDILLANGPFAFFKGYVPAFVRLAPHTVLTFMFLEQLKLHFGYIPLK